jgi:hypothetical protein
MSDAPNVLPNGRPDIGSMSGPQAQAALDGLIADPAWSARLAKRDSSAHDEMHRLSARISGVDLPVHADGLARNQDGSLDLFAARKNVGAETTSSYHGSPSMSEGEKLEQFQMLRDQGFDDSLILRQFDDDRSHSAELIAAMKQKWAALEGDEGFRRRLLAGEFQARKDFKTYCQVVTAKVRDW